MTKYTQEQIDEIAYHHNWSGLEQDDDGNLAWNTSTHAITGWRRVTDEQIDEALAGTGLANG